MDQCVKQPEWNGRQPNGSAPRNPKWVQPKGSHSLALNTTKCHKSPRPTNQIHQELKLDGGDLMDHPTQSKTSASQGVALARNLASWEIKNHQTNNKRREESDKATEQRGNRVVGKQSNERIKQQEMREQSNERPSEQSDEGTGQRRPREQSNKRSREQSNKRLRERSNERMKNGATREQESGAGWVGCPGCRLPAWYEVQVEFERMINLATHPIKFTSCVWSLTLEMHDNENLQNKIEKYTTLCWLANEIDPAKRSAKWVKIEQVMLNFRTEHC